MQCRLPELPDDAPGVVETAARIAGRPRPVL